VTRDKERVLRGFEQRRGYTNMKVEWYINDRSLYLMCSFILFRHSPILQSELARILGAVYVGCKLFFERAH